ncbi:MAG: hypothetical protein CM15mP32_0670 [Flavobacteriaceae bacterium]|nr:MAG: hypothetical protein CM15mP32_0670 [Flavobacteriaceae bacterium]
MIVGYPGETQEDFELLKQWVSDTRFDRLGCFTYSHEENTHALSMSMMCLLKSSSNVPMKLWQYSLKYLGKKSKSVWENTSLFD